MQKRSVAFSLLAVLVIGSALVGAHYIFLNGKDSPDIVSPDSGISTKDWHTYTSQQFRFSFKYPKGWSVVNGTNAVEATSSLVLYLNTKSSDGMYVTVSISPVANWDGYQSVSQILKGIDSNGIAYDAVRSLQVSDAVGAEAMTYSDHNLTAPEDGIIFSEFERGGFSYEFKTGGDLTRDEIGTYRDIVKTLNFD